jgi:AraC family transcriptional regulator of adaptative response / methylphosphotriester-DNA alkyltransferase methyltransferase
MVARHYRRRLTLPALAAALASSPRELQRAYAEFGNLTFREDLQGRRLRAAAELLAQQPSIPVAVVARLVGYSQAPHFGRVFCARFGLPPGRFREQARLAGAQSPSSPAEASGPPLSCLSSPGKRCPAGSEPGSPRRISVPPPGAVSAVTLPPC